MNKIIHKASVEIDGEEEAVTEYAITIKYQRTDSKKVVANSIKIEYNDAEMKNSQILKNLFLYLGSDGLKIRPQEEEKKEIAEGKEIKEEKKQE